MMIHEMMDSLIHYGMDTLLLFGLGYGINYLRNRVGTENFDKYIHMAQVFVHSVEQEIGPGNGPLKKSEVIRLLKKISKGRLPEDVMDKLIESAVYDMQHEYDHTLRIKKRA